MFDLKEVNDFVRDLNDCFNKPEPNDYQSTVTCLEKLTKKYGTDSYHFNYVTEKIVEIHWTTVKPVLPKICDDYMAKINQNTSDDTLKQVAFAAYYTLSLVYKKDNNLDELGKLTGDVYFKMQQFPLYHEVKARYHKRIGDYANALSSDALAISRLLEEINITNPAVLVSYASTVTKVCESGNISTLSDDTIENALGYIDEAIKCNPSYPKYYYIKAKLIYYKSRSNKDSDEFKASCNEAKDLIRVAISKISWKDISYHANIDSMLYSNFITVIDTELNKINKRPPFEDLTEEQIREKKDFILHASCAQNCKPEKPALKPGQKYIFISYSSADFKSVYCDLVDLYAKKIPFDYDEALPFGDNWILRVKEKINNDDCIGVLFFLSANTVLSDSIEKEIVMMKNKFGSEFANHRAWVNLEGGKAPFRIMIDSIRNNEIHTLLEKGISAERINTYINTFNKEAVFVTRDTQPDSNSHLEALVRAIKEGFVGLSL